jgi:Icc-related predicted phosphoesterase
MFSVCCISDPHGLHRRIDMPVWVDMAICAGDISMTGEFSVIEDFLEWFDSLPYKYKIFIAGNHDLTFQSRRDQIAELIKSYPNIIYLEDSGVEIEGFKIWGSPYTPWFGNWAFMEPDHMLRPRWDMIPNDVDILITHGPAKYMLDRVLRGQHVGSEELRSRIIRLNNLKLHVFGHIHEEYGYLGTLEEVSKEFVAVNASVVDLSYRVVNKPIVVHLTSN